MQTPEEMNSLFEQTQLAGAVGQQAQASASAQYYVQEQEKTLAAEQLDCGKTLNEIYHLLRQDVLAPSADGTIEWKPRPDSQNRALTDIGVDRIMQLVKSYVNKETLLSNFDDVQIPRRMLEFCLALNANFFMKYELYFMKPTFEECVAILKTRIDEQVKIKRYSREMLGLPSNDLEVRKEILKEMEHRIEQEIGKIRQERIRQNLREYELLFVQIKAIVEAVHNRAWKGEERGSLRRHTNISEVIGGRQQMPQDGGMFKWAK